MPTTFGSNSRFRRATAISVPNPIPGSTDTVNTMGRWRRPSWLTTPLEPANVRQVVVTSGLEGRPDLVANVIYGTPDLDWVLIAFNNITNTMDWPRSGDIVQYPISSVVIPTL